MSCKPVAVMDDGWSEWIHPLPGYLMQCCDCGLVHEMEAAIGLSSGGDNGPRNEGETKRRVVIFRMRRASGIETEGHDPEEGHGAKHESPTGEAGDAQ